MKRNDMEVIMSDAFDEFMEAQIKAIAIGRTAQILGCKNVFEYILKKMEEAGMMPPTTFLEKLGTKDNGWD